MNTVKYHDLGKIGYAEAWQLQEQLFAEVVETKMQNRNAGPAKIIKPNHHFLLCEHFPVITLGRNAEEKNLVMSEQFLKNKNVELFHINRGGDITFHGPGQIVGYPILDLDHFFTDIGKYLRCLEDVIIQTLAACKIQAGRLPGATGVWLDAQDARRARKMCAIGIRCSRWVTMHGFAFNVNTDLQYFNYIIPCGIQDKAVTSLEKELGEKQDYEKVKDMVKFYFEKVFDCKLEQNDNK